MAIETTLTLMATGYLMIFGFVFLKIRQIVKGQ
jgi:hypothetical protein